MKSEKADFIIVRDAFRWMSFLIIVIARIQRINIVVYSQTQVNEKKTFIKLILYRFVLYLSRGVWVSPVKGPDYLKSNLANKLHYLPFATEINFRDKIFSEGPIQILSIGKFVERKNHLLLLKCIKMLRDDNFNIRLTIVGEVSTLEHQEYIERVYAFIDKNKLSNIVDIYKNIKYRKMREFYSNSDLFILPAQNEPASVSVVEALGYGLPVICSNTCGTRFYVKNGENGFIFDNNSIVDLYRCVKVMLNRDMLNKI